MKMDSSQIVVITALQALKNYPEELARALEQVSHVGNTLECSFTIDQYGLGHRDDEPLLLLSASTDYEFVPGQRELLFVQPILKPAAITLA
jgi:hypothetical protein